MIWLILLFTQNTREPNRFSSVMDLVTHKQLFKGQSKDGLYPVPLALLQEATHPQANLASLPVWHQRLGHAHLESVKKVLR
ncbi:hypothetical protein LINPERHAP2_LOCUS6244, partial [Linum perenne]